MVEPSALVEGKPSPGARRQEQADMPGGCMRSLKSRSGPRGGADSAGRVIAGAGGGSVVLGIRPYRNGGRAMAADPAGSP
jgi:hypothetical protein